MRNIKKNQYGQYVDGDTGEVLKSLNPDPPKTDFNKKDTPANLVKQANSELGSGRPEMAASIMDFLVTNSQDQADTSWRRIHLMALLSSGTLQNSDQYPSYLESLTKAKK
jgi:hypothetical protein